MHGYIESKSPKMKSNGILNENEHRKLIEAVFAKSSTSVDKHKIIVAAYATSECLSTKYKHKISTRFVVSQ